MDEPSYDRPLAAIRVVDMSQGLAGPACGMLLAAHGASVVKIEPPKGDWSRQMGTRYGDHTALELAVNRGKRSLALDLKAPRGLAIARRLLDQADVVIQSARPGVADTLGVGYDAVRRTNPAALYVSISGYGRAGPYADRPATDTVIQAHSGLMAINGQSSGAPSRIGFVVVDIAAAMNAFQAVVTSLIARRDEGRFIDIGLAQSAASLITPKVIEAHLEGAAPRPLNAPAGCYRAADVWIAITLVREADFAAMCGVLGLAHLATDPRYDSYEKRGDTVADLIPLVADVVKFRDADHWIAAMTTAGVMCNRVNTVTDWLTDEHVQATDAAPMLAQDSVRDGAVPVVRIPGLPEAAIANLALGAPVIGEQGREILGEIGNSDEEISALIADGIVIVPGGNR
jgi:crotonobetainyl-CoA:carnitine CoA-transferase CaiB-like acyl-CoA transferase